MRAIRQYLYTVTWRRLQHNRGHARRHAASAECLRAVVGLLRKTAGMSRRNREKRATKQKKRQRAAAERERMRFDPAPDHALVLERLVLALSEAATGPGDHAARRAAELLDLYGATLHDLDVAADIAVSEAIRAAWEHGWSPSDLNEIARRKLDSSSVRYVEEAIVIESKRYSVATLHPKWRADLAGISAGIESASRAPQMWRWAASNALDRRGGLTAVIGVMKFLGRLPVLEPLLALPGAYRPTSTATSGVDEKGLSRVRALLAKAEATEFPDEAEALSAKAQELMSRYSLREAVADYDRGRAPLATARRIWIDNPYPTAKASLVQAVGRANRCPVVWADLGFVTVVGTETDLDLVELLTTSLLVQANRAMLQAGRRVGSGGQARTRSFRQSFLVAYATRIGERLERTSASVTADIQRDSRLLPVLAANSRAADELTDRLFPSTVPRPVSVSNGAGWGAGRAAADLACLDVHDAIAG
jgi:hypothetical protein